jgi:hypothetical protein
VRAVLTALGGVLGDYMEQERSVRLVIGWWRESTPIIKYFLLSNLSAQGLLGNSTCACFAHMIMPYY